jgi:hypothetical protein
MFKPDEHTWLRFIDLGTREMGIMSNIVARLDKTATLTSATRASRQMLNGCVTCVKIGPAASNPTTELATIFPNADDLRIQDREPLIAGQLAASSPAFLGTLRTLHIDAEGADEFCHTLLPRYCSPQYTCARVTPVDHWTGHLYQPSSLHGSVLLLATGIIELSPPIRTFNSCTSCSSMWVLLDLHQGQQHEQRPTSAHTSTSAPSTRTSLPEYHMLLTWTAQASSCGA